KDDGATWDDITPPGMTPDSTVNAIALSPHQTGRAFLAVHRYRMDDFGPSLWRTDDHGANWKLLTNGSNGIPADHPTRAVAEDPNRRGLLYAGTEFGLFVSFDDGAHWQTLKLNLPVTPITDLRVHNQDLVVATQGRSFWILDDLTPLHQLHEGITDSAVYLFEPRDSCRVADMARFRGSRTPQQPDGGAPLLFWLEEEPGEPVTLEILTPDGKVLRTFDSEEDKERIRKDDDPVLPAAQGMNRFVWDLKRSGPELLDKALFSLAYTGAYYVLPGTYTARLKVGDTELTQPIRVLKDPRLSWVSDEDLRVQTALVEEIAATLENVHNSIGQLRSVRDQIRAMTERATKAGYGGEWEQRGDQIAERLTSIEEELIQTQAQTNQDLLNYPPRLDDQLAYLYSHVYQAYGRPTEGSYQRLEDLRQQLVPHLESLREVLESDLVEFDEALRETGIPPVIVLTRDPAER
ncbi:MAG: sialidase family protein, partial [Thermoanaerobaculia bacterium]